MFFDETKPIFLVIPGALYIGCPMEELERLGVCVLLHAVNQVATCGTRATINFCPFVPVKSRDVEMLLLDSHDCNACGSGGMITNNEMLLL